MLKLVIILCAVLLVSAEFPHSNKQYYKIRKEANKKITTARSIINNTNNTLKNVDERIQWLYTHMNELVMTILTTVKTSPYTISQSPPRIITNDKEYMRTPECIKDLTNTFDTARKLVENITESKIQKLQTGVNYKTEFSDIYRLVKKKFEKVQKDFNRCNKNPGNLRSSALAILCTQTAGYEALWTAGSITPEENIVVSFINTIQENSTDKASISNYFRDLNYIRFNTSACLYDLL